MKISLITTTIYVPHVLELYRSFNSEISFFVTGDRKTPHQEVQALINRLGNGVYYSDTDQEKLGYESSEIIGWNKIMRRNIAILEALKHGADVIITIDDDNIPVNQKYFEDFVKLFSSPFQGIKVFPKQNWFNVGDFIFPKIFHRGFPYDLRQTKLDYQLTATTNTKIGVAAGMWLGDPDIDAMERITNQPTVLNFSELLDSGLVLDNQSFSPVDSQNTAFIRELAPLMMVWVGVGRYDDIWASYIAERVMATTDYCIHFGKPYVWQERNRQNLWKNLEDEIYGMKNTPQFCHDLWSMDPGDGTTIEKLENLYEQLKSKTYLPPVVYELGKAWCRDNRRILNS